MNIAVIGGGASGMVSAVILAQGGCEVSVFEHMPRIGKKLLVTGSGKCNISNTDMDLSHFHGTSKTVIKSVLEYGSPDKTRAFFEKLGLFYKDRNGFLYPYCEQASAVVDILRFAIRDLGIDVYTDTDIRRIIKCDRSYGQEHEDRFLIETADGKFLFDKVVLCCGSKAARNTGSDGSGYKLAGSFGHSIIKPLPALTSLICEETFYPSIAGVRTKACVRVFAGRGKTGSFDLLAQDEGELQITKTGISGIVVFNLSFCAIRALDEGRIVKASIDFLPEISDDGINGYIRGRIGSQPDRTAEEMFIGLFAKPLGICICKRCGIDLGIKCSELDETDIARLCECIKRFDTVITGYGGFDQAQVAQGGVSLDEVTEYLESTLVNGLYFAGEILDVNGDCGGYNLQWAASSAMCVAEHIIGVYN